MVQRVSERPDTHEMVIVHRVFRREFRLAPAMVTAVADGDRERAALVAAHLVELCGLLHHHHASEDELVWPRLYARTQVSTDLVQRMEAQHERVGTLLARVDQLLPEWRDRAETAVGAQLADALGDVSSVLDEHLVEEERDVLPLVAEHLTGAEWSELGERGMASVPKPRLLVVLGHILEEASPEERVAFLARVPTPARVAYRLLGRRKYEREVAALRQGLDVPRQRQG